MYRSPTTSIYTVFCCELGQCPILFLIWAHTLCKHVTCIHSPGTGKLLKQDHYQGRDLPQGVEGVERPIIPRSHPIVHPISLSPSSAPSCVCMCVHYVSGVCVRVCMCDKVVRMGRHGEDTHIPRKIQYPTCKVSLISLLYFVG